MLKSFLVFYFECISNANQNTKVMFSFQFRSKKAKENEKHINCYKIFINDFNIIVRIYVLFRTKIQSK